MRTPTKRWQLFELHDFSWFPSAWRVYVQDLLRFFWCLQAPAFLRNMLGLQAPYSVAASELRKAITEVNAHTVVDVCSGGGGPIHECQTRLARHGVDVDFILTDLYPNIGAFRRISLENPRISYVSEPVDATNCRIEGFRTMFACFHHFPPGLVKKMIWDAIEKNQGIAVFECTKNSPITCLLYLVALPVLTLVCTPFLKVPFSIGRFFWTYIIPVVPFVITFDGLVSNLRTYSLDELRSLVEEIDTEKRFRWRIREKPFVSFLPYVTVTSLVGTPKLGNIVPKARLRSNVGVIGAEIYSTDDAFTRSSSSRRLSGTASSSHYRPL